MTSAKLLGCILGLGGIIIMNITPRKETVFSFSFLGEGLVLLSTISLAVSGILVKKYSKDFNGMMKDVEIMRMLGCARKSYYKWKKELRAEMAA